MFRHVSWMNVRTQAVTAGVQGVNKTWMLGVRRAECVGGKLGA